MKTITIFAVIAIVAAVGIFMSSSIAVSVHAAAKEGKGQTCSNLEPETSKKQCLKDTPPPGKPIPAV